MALFRDQILKGTDPGANLGASFTSSIAERELVFKRKYLHQFVLGLKGDLAATTTVAMESFVDVLNPFVFKKGSEVRIQLRGRDLVALQYFFDGSLPTGFEGAAGEDDKIFGIRLPVWETFDPAASYTFSATRVAVTNVSGEVITLAADFYDDPLEPSPIIAVEQPFTSAAATGRTNLNIIIPQVGDLIGLIVFNSTVPTATADSATTHRITLTVNGVLESEFSMAEARSVAGGSAGISTNWPYDVLNNYAFFDLRKSPLDAKNNRVGVIVDVQAVNEAARLIPVLVKK